MVNFTDLIEQIPNVLEQVDKQDVSELIKFFHNNANIPLITFGAGGAVSPMRYASLLYSTNMSISKAYTALGLDAVSDEALKNSKVLILSNGGGNIDVHYVADRLVSLKHKAVGCMSMRYKKGSKHIIDNLSKITSNWFVYPCDVNDDGFLCLVPALFNFGIIYRAFTKSKVLDRLKVDVRPEACFSYKARLSSDHLPSFKDIDCFTVLYGGYGEPAAYDFESKMMEGGYAPTILSDYRNYTHGRFVFNAFYSQQYARKIKDLKDKGKWKYEDYPQPRNSALILFVSKREKQFVEDLFNSKRFRGEGDVFPSDMPIITIETEYDDALASVDLLIKSNVLYNEIAKSIPWNDNPSNPKSYDIIDKVVPIHTRIKGRLKRGALTSLEKGSYGTIKSVDRKKTINYDPNISIEDNANKNKVSIDAIRKYIKDKHIDRSVDEQMIKWNKVWCIYLEDSTQKYSIIAQRSGYSLNTVKGILQTVVFDKKPSEGKIGLVAIDDRITDARDDEASLISFYDKVKTKQAKHPECSEVELSKSFNLKSNKDIDLFSKIFNSNELKYHFEDYKPIFDYEIKNENASVPCLGIIGAICGDIIGIPYEYKNAKKNKEKKVLFTPYDFPLYKDGELQGSYSDDTIMILSIAKWLMLEERTEDNLISTILDVAKRYSKAKYWGRNFKKWLNEEQKPYGATTNGAAMRVSAIAYCAKSLSEVLELTKMATVISHNSDEAVRGAQSVASAIFLTRQGKSKEEVKQYITETFGYNLDRTVEEIIPTYLFSATCDESVPEAIICWLNSDGYEDAVRKAVSLGGDSDTQGCISGSISSAVCPVPEQIAIDCFNKLPSDLKSIFLEFEEFIK